MCGSRTSRQMSPLAFPPTKLSDIHRTTAIPSGGPARSTTLSVCSHA